jgi:transglutaminase-like putative cysteine protease
MTLAPEIDEADIRAAVRAPRVTEASASDAASHAWVDAFDDERGWISVDLTHGREQTAAYVRVAVGRDYADVPPTRGVYKGSAEETLTVEVSLSPL